jgi:hypothetical protein
LKKNESILNENKDQDVIKKEFNGKTIEFKKDSLQHSIRGIKKALKSRKILNDREMIVKINRL